MQPNNSSVLHLEVAASALGEGLPGADQLIRAVHHLIGQQFAADLISAGSVRGKITGSANRPFHYEVLAIFLSNSTYTAVTHKLTFSFENEICTLLASE